MKSWSQHLFSSEGELPTHEIGKLSSLLLDRYKIVSFPIHISSDEKEHQIAKLTLGYVLQRIAAMQRLAEVLSTPSSDAFVETVFDNFPIDEEARKFMKSSLLLTEELVDYRNTLVSDIARTKHFLKFDSISAYKMLSKSAGTRDVITISRDLGVYEYLDLAKIKHTEFSIGNLHNPKTFIEEIFFKQFVRLYLINLARFVSIDEAKNYFENCLRLIDVSSTESFMNFWNTLVKILNQGSTTGMHWFSEALSHICAMTLCIIGSPLWIYDMFLEEGALSTFRMEQRAPLIAAWIGSKELTNMARIYKYEEPYAIKEFLTWTPASPMSLIR